MQSKTVILLVSVIVCLAYGNYFDDLNALMKDYASCPSLKLAGHSLVVVKNGATIYKQVGGMRDIVNNLSVTNDTVFAIGSNSKQFTTLLLAQLYEEGLVDFDAPVINYIPELDLGDSYITKEVSLHDLLTHHSGLARNDWLIMLNNTFTAEQLLPKLKNWPLSTGFRYQATYCSWGYVIARIVIERVTGQSFEEAVKTRIFAPLGMKNSYPTTAETLLNEPQNYAKGHALNTNLDVVPIVPFDTNRIFDGIISGAGGIHLSVGDLEKYLMSLQSNFPDITPSTFKLVTTQKARSVAPRTLDLTIPFGLYFSLYSYGFMNGEYHGAKYFSHNGGTIGHSSYILTFPNEKISIGLMTNSHLVNSLSYFLLFTQIYDIVSGIPHDNSSTCTFSTGTVLLSKDNYPSSIISKRNKYSGSYYNPVYGSIEIYNAETDNELYLSFGVLTGKLRPTSTDNKFVWFTENYFEGDSLTFTFYFNPAGVKAKSLSVSLDHTVPEYVFEKKRAQ